MILDITNNISLLDSLQIEPKNSEIDVNDLIVKSFEYYAAKDMEINIQDSINKSMIYEDKDNTKKS